MPRTIPRREGASVGPQKAIVHMEKHAHSSMTRTRKAKARDDLVHLLRQVRCTEIRNVTEEVALTGSAEGTPKFTRKSPSGKANRLLCTIFKRGILPKGSSCDY